MIDTPKEAATGDKAARDLMLSELLQVCTPAPWQVNFFDGNQISDADGESRGCSPIAKTFGGKKEKANNAKLIALAPTIAAELIKERANSARLLSALQLALKETSGTTRAVAYSAIKQAEEL